MHQSIFATPEQAQDDSRLSWLHTDPADDAIMNEQMDAVYATDEPSLGVADWPLH
jgi:hypothetical protein